MEKIITMKRLFTLFLCVQVAFTLDAQIFEINQNFPEVNGASRSANWVDLNLDGNLDIFITNGPSSGQNNEAYLGFGNGNFVPYNADDPMMLDQSPSVGATFAHANTFPGMDVFIATWYNERNLHYTWSGDIFEQVEVAPPADEFSYSETGAFGDADADGFLELYVTNSAGSDLRNLYYAPSQLGAFIQISDGEQVQDEGASRGVTWIDYDNDGDADLFITNEDNAPNRLYQNQGDGSFLAIENEIITVNAGATMSGTWGDYNNDGYMDLFICNYGSDNQLYRNSPDGFIEITESVVSSDGGYSFSANWGDIDNDGDLDLFVSNAFEPDNQTLNNFLYINNGDETFTKVESEIVSQNEGWTYGNAFGDYDEDGDMDLLTANCYNDAEANRLYRNTTSDGEDSPSWIEIHCVGTISNPLAVGTRVSVLAVINGEEVWQTREISSQSSYCGQNMYPVHFGLGDADEILELTLDWPSSPTETYTNLEVNQHFGAVEGNGPMGIDEIEEIPVVIYPNPAVSQVNLAFEKDISAPMHLKVFDLQGKEVLDLGPLQVGVNRLEYDISNLPAGTFLFRGTGAETEFVRKIYITR